MCLGGTLLATTLAVMAARNDTRIASVTYLTTLVDFSDPGDMAVFTSDAHLEELEHETARNGYLDASVMAETFSMLRANDLVWSVAIKSYFLGQEPAPFDLLFWNADSTRMPGGLHMSYLRDMYRDNRLVQSGGIVVDGVPVDLGQIRIPTYILSTREDHIAPWRSTYAATQVYGGKTTFVLAGSGHVGGVVNPVIEEIRILAQFHAAQHSRRMACGSTAFTGLVVGALAGLAAQSRWRFGSGPSAGRTWIDHRRRTGQLCKARVLTSTPAPKSIAKVATHP